MATSKTRRTAELLNSAAITLLRSMARHDRQSGLTPARLSALSVIVFGGPCTLGRLASAEQVAGPTMTRIVDGLVRDGLLVRSRHEEDRRAVVIDATDEGRRVMLAARDLRVTVIAEAMAALPPEDRALLVRAAPVLLDLGHRTRTGEGRTGGGPGLPS